MHQELHRKRCKCYNIEGHAHYLTFSCFRRQKLLEYDRTRQWLIDSIARARTRRGFELWAFVVMPEHVHLVLLPHEGTLVEGILTSIKTPVSRRAVAWVKRRAPSFLG